MRLIRPLTLLLLAAALVMTPASAETLEGQWILDEAGTASVEMSLSYRETSSRGNWHEQTSKRIALEALPGLDSSSLGSAAGANVAFELRREAGVFRCEGWSRKGRASGHFTFVPDKGFADELDRLGFGTPSARESLSLALSDTGMDLVREIARAGWEDVTVRQLVRAAHHGVTATYVRDMRELGYRPATIDALIRMRDHGVTAEFVREIQSLGIAGLDENGIVRLRDHGVTPDFIRGMKAAGFGDLDARQLVRLRDHGVTPEYARAIRGAGLSKVTPDELVRLKSHGVSPDDVRGMKGQ